MKQPLGIRITIWATLMGLVVLVWVAVVVPVLTWRSDTSELLLAEQDKAERLLQSIGTLEQEFASLSSETEIQDIWRAGSLGEATAQVQASLGSIARKRGVIFRSIAPLQSPEMPLVSAVAFRLEAELTLDQLVNLLKAIEYSAPLLLVERSNIRRLTRGNANATQPTVFAQLDVLAPVILPEDDV